MEQAHSKLYQEKADECRIEAKNVLKRSQLPKTNITREEVKAIKELREDDIRMIMTTDKWVALVVMDKED